MSETAIDLGKAGDTPPDIHLSGMSKRFGTLVALDDVSLRLRPGSFHALLGENGAGKSTLVKCAMGFYRPDEGSVLIDGQSHHIRSPLEAHRLRLGMVYQRFTLVPSMTVAENLLLAKVRFSAIVNWRRERKEMERFLGQMPFGLDLDSPIKSLAAGEKQKVEILKQLYLNVQVLILDEPTSVLTPDEADQILGLLKEMVGGGSLSVVLITHKLRELFAFASEVTVLRGGRVAGSGPVADFDSSSLTELMVGAHDLEGGATRDSVGAGEVRLEVVSLSALNDRGHQAFRDLSLKVHAHEIVGVAGVSGNGQKELVEVLSGQREATGGSIHVHGKTYTPTRKEMRKHNVYCLPEEPLTNAAVGRMSVAENLALREFDVSPFTKGKWFVNESAMRESARRLVEEYSIRTVSVDAPAEFLSGGNVQRMVLARELAHSVQVLIAANPSFGLDVKAISEIRANIVSARNRGAAVLLLSEDLDEIFELSDRIVVMFEGGIAFESPIGDAERSTIGHRMAGH